MRQGTLAIARWVTAVLAVAFTLAGCDVETFDDAVAQSTAEPDGEAWWERHFEHLREPIAFFEATLARQLSMTATMPKKRLPPIMMAETSETVL